MFLVGDVEEGLATWWASWYGRGGGAISPASGERLRPGIRPDGARIGTCRSARASPSTNTRNGRAVDVRINDRGPFGHRDRIIDLSEAAAERLGIIDAGVAPITLQVVRLGKR